VPIIEIEVKPFSTSDVIVALKCGHIKDGSFVSSKNGDLYKHPELMKFARKSTSSKFGKASYTENWMLTIPDDCPVAIAAYRRTGAGSVKTEFIYEVVFVPVSERQ